MFDIQKAMQIHFHCVKVTELYADNKHSIIIIEEATQKKIEKTNQNDDKKYTFYH